MTVASWATYRKACGRTAADMSYRKRDAALLLLGYAAATRSSELVALDIADLVEVEEGILVSIYRQKLKQFTDSAIPYGKAPQHVPGPRSARPGRRAPGGRPHRRPRFVRVDRHGRIAQPMLRHG
jgi:integrase